MKNLALIPARGGSKRIPKKNIKLFCGEPIISYSIKAAIQSGLFDEVMVSTDDAKIAETAQKYGAEVPFFRSTASSGDYATLAEVIDEVLLNYQGLSKSFDEICCVLPTAPFVTAKKLKAGLELMQRKGHSAVFTAKAFDFPIQRALKVDEASGKVAMFWPEHMKTRSQDLPMAYHDVGQFYWLSTPTFLEEKQLYAENSGILIVPEMEAQDIDTEEDWEVALFKYQMLYNKL